MLLIASGGIDAQVAHPCAVCGDGEEEIAGEAELVAPFGEALVEPIEWVLPELFEKLVRCSVGALGLDLVADVLAVRVTSRAPAGSGAMRAGPLVGRCRADSCSGRDIPRSNRRPG